MEIPQAVTDARSEAAKLGKVASDYAASEYTIPDQLKKIVQESLNYNKDIIGMRSTAMADYMTAPAEANKKFGVETFSTGDKSGQKNPDFIFNPFERNAAIQSFVGNQSIPFSTSNALLGMREGTIADTVNAGTRAFQAQSAASQAAAQSARQTYQDVLSEFGMAEDIKIKQKQLEQEQQRIDIARYTAEKSGAGEGASIAEMLALLMQDDQGTVDTSGLDSFIEEDEPQQSQRQQGNQAPNTSQPLSTNEPNMWDRFTGWLGATPKQGQEPKQSQLSQNIRGLKLDFGGLPGVGK